MSNLQKWLRYGLGGVVGLASLGALYQAIESRKDLQKYAPPGKRVDIGGYALHINCVGEGSPTVILDSGLSHNALVWSLVQAAIAEITKVCSYDRAGYGWSDPGPKPRTSQQIAHELYRLLQNADISGPYVLVGHSFGGLNIRLFADMYPDNIVGMILVDAAHEDQRHRIPQPPLRTRLIQKLQWQWFRFNPLWARLGILRLRNKPNCAYQKLSPETREVASQGKGIGYDKLSR